MKPIPILMAALINEADAKRRCVEAPSMVGNHLVPCSGQKQGRSLFGHSVVCELVKRVT